MTTPRTAGALRLVDHPGIEPAQPVRRAVPAGLQTHRFELPAGCTLLDGLNAALQGRGARSAVARLLGGASTPFAYVMPALSRTPAHAVYFSDRHDADGPVAFDEACVTFGLRADGRPWLHCHADWTDADGARHAGHVLPDQAWLSAPVQVQAWALQGAAFAVEPDAYTGFTLFQPVADGPPSAGPPPALAVRLGPNQDVCEALEAICLAHGHTGATVRGGVGSTVGAVFDDGRRVEAFVTETLVRAGRIAPDATGRPRAALEVTLVDHLGGRHQGRLARGANAVLVTFELVLDFGAPAAGA